MPFPGKETVMMDLKKIIARYLYRKPIHFRHLLNFAIDLEGKAAEFYRHVGDITDNDNVRELSYRISREEKGHKQALERVLSRWVSLDYPADENAQRLFKLEMDEQGVLVDTFSPDMNEKDLFKYAIKQEDNMVKYYRAFEKRFPSEWKREKLRNIIAEEERHKTQLQKLFREIFNAES